MIVGKKIFLDLFEQLTKSFDRQCSITRSERLTRNECSDLGEAKIHTMKVGALSAIVHIRNLKSYRKEGRERGVQYLPSVFKVDIEAREFLRAPADFKTLTLDGESLLKPS